MKLSIDSSFDVYSHFRTTALYETHGGVFKFAKNKINVVLGPNGSGKSTLLDILSLLSFSTEIGQSRCCDEYLADKYWKAESNWGRWSTETYLAGIQWSEGYCNALSFKPHRIPGNEDNVVTSMMCGYFEEARAYGEITENKSSGQSIGAQLADIWQFIENESTLKISNAKGFELSNWEQKELTEYSRPSRSSRKQLLSNKIKEGKGHQLLIIDEPEQSLDMRTNLQFWQRLAQFKPKNTTVIVASHSPFALRESFNFIEAQTGYLKEIEQLLAAQMG